MGPRWQVSQSIYRELGIPAQCVTYDGTGHEIKPEIIEDVVEFFRANTADGFVEIEPHEYPFVEFREIKVAHVNGVYWRGVGRIAEWARDLFDGQGDFIITIEEWMAGQNHRQLDAFAKNAAFRFVLRAAGHEDILIAEEYSQGNCSSGQGDFQGFVVGLPPAESAKLARGIAYALVPVEQGDEYIWEVRDGVHLVRP
jgi:hypothetical protein